jgi:hypothetical protein
MVAKNNTYVVPGTMEGTDGRAGYGQAGDIWITLPQASALTGLGQKMLKHICRLGDVVTDGNLPKLGEVAKGGAARYRISLKSIMELKAKHEAGTYSLPFARNGWGAGAKTKGKGHPHSGNALLRKKVDNLEGMMRQLLSALAPKEEPPTP